MTDLQRSRLLVQCAKGVAIIEGQERAINFFDSDSIKKDSDKRLIDVIIEIRRLGDELLSNVEY